MFRRAAFSLAIAAVLVGALVPAAGAHVMDNNWYINDDQVGYCGQTQSGWVMAVQGNLLTHYIGLGTSGPHGNGIDGVVGSQTHSGIVEWQDRHGLQRDGCVGNNTWQNMKDLNYHRFYLGNDGGSGQLYDIRGHDGQRRYRYRIDACWGGAANINSVKSDGSGPDYFYVKHTIERQVYICL